MTALEASRKVAICTSAAMVGDSSSQSNNVSWQPSNTGPHPPTSAWPCRAPSAAAWSCDVVTDDGAVRQAARTRPRPCPHQPTPHCMLRSSEHPDVVERQLSSVPTPAGVSHHHLRAAQEADRVGRPHGQPAQRLRDEADFTRPPLHGRVDGHMQLDVCASRPLLEFASKQEIVTARAPAISVSDRISRGRLRPARPGAAGPTRHPPATDHQVAAGQRSGCRTVPAQPDLCAGLRVRAAPQLTAPNSTVWVTELSSGVGTPLTENRPTPNVHHHEFPGRSRGGASPTGQEAKDHNRDSRRGGSPDRAPDAWPSRALPVVVLSRVVSVDCRARLVIVVLREF